MQLKLEYRNVLQRILIAFIFLEILISLISENLWAQAPVYKIKVVRVYPHCQESFTQGLAIENNVLYESVGLYGKSAVLKVDLKTGNILMRKTLPDQYFGEGMCLFQDTLIQLTWLSNVGFVYDKTDLKQLKSFSYSTEGWGITTDGMRLIMSDGTSQLYFLNPHSFERIGTIQVVDNHKPIKGLNELEYVEGEVFANVWQTDNIARISPQTGSVLGWIDLSQLHSYETDFRDVLNGIAYDSKQKRLFVTGKFWKNLYEIEIIPPYPPNPIKP